jgi:hypothetical protein
MAGDDLRRLAEGIGTALQEWARSSPSESGFSVPDLRGRTIDASGSGGVIVSPETTLIFRDNNERSVALYLPRLVSVLEKSSTLANDLYEYAKSPCSGHHSKSTKKSALRKAATMRDSLQQISHLVRGEDLDALPKAGGYIEPTEDELSLREAHIFKMLKAIQDYPSAMNVEDLRAELQLVLDFIKDREPIPTNEDN